MIKHKLLPHIDKSEFKFGDIIDDKLRINILNSREMCVVVSSNSNSSEWVATEWGAAWILGKDLVPIILDKNIDIPDRLKRRFYVDSDSDEELEKYARQLVENKYKSEAERFIRFFSR